MPMDIWVLSLGNKTNYPYVLGSCTGKYNCKLIKTKMYLIDVNTTKKF